MIILHGAFLEERLFLWGEAPTASQPAGRSNGRRRANGADPYPFDAGFDATAKVIRTLPLGFRPTKRRKETALAWLPTRGSHPLPSSALIGEAPGSRAKVRIAPWQVEGLALDADECLDLLCAYGDRSGSVHGLIGGRDFAFWLSALRVAGSLVARQRYLPGIASRDGHYVARWEPVWLGSDTGQLEKLAGRMPAAARALTPEATRDAPQHPASELVAGFITALVDQIVRSHVDAGAKAAGAEPAKAAPVANGSVHDRWLAALYLPNGEVRGTSEELEPFVEQVRAWRQPLDTAARAPFRLCFRLEEPSAPREEPGPRRGRGPRNGRGRALPRAGQRRWYVRYLLQGIDDASLLVPTADAWITRGRKAAALSREGTDVHETLLSSLAQAAGVCPRIEESLRSRKPSGYSLDARGAHDFLTRTAPALEQAGFGTLLPEWWTGTGTLHRLGVRARVRTPPFEETDGEISLDDTAEFDWEIALDGKAVSGRELEELARLKEPIQRVRGHWVETNVEEIHAALEFWKNRKAGAVTAREIVRMALGAADTSAGIRFEGVRATGWMNDLLSRLVDKSAIPPVPTPPGFVGQLRRYQESGFAWLDFLREWGLGACLADDMGLGKTIQTLALIQREREQGEDRPVLLVCPTSVLANWEREAARFTPKLSVVVHHGPAREKGWDFTQRAQDNAIVLTSYALLHRDLEASREHPWRTTSASCGPSWTS
jgi:hypothetical protein